MTQKNLVASIIMAAGRGSRMKGYNGNKTLLPLIPGTTQFEGRRPFIHNILENLPKGPKCIVVNHHKKKVMEATSHFHVSYSEQKILNGTGGALLSCKPFLQMVNSESIIITMGDVPLVRKETYLGLLAKLAAYHMAVLGFMPNSKRQYGLLELNGDTVNRIVEWKYWKDMPREYRERLSVCNSGIYAVKRDHLLEHLADLEHNPHNVEKQINGKKRIINEYFLTDLVEIFSRNGKSVGYEVVKDPDEVMGVDDIEALLRAQQLYKSSEYGGQGG